MNFKTTIFLAFSIVLLLVLGGCAEFAGEAFYNMASRTRCIESSKGTCAGNVLSVERTSITETGCNTAVTTTDCGSPGCFGPRGKARCRTEAEAIAAGIIIAPPTPPPGSTTTTPTAVNCVTQYGAGFKCISRTSLEAERAACTADGKVLTTHCASGDPVCILTLAEPVAVAKVPTSPTVRVPTAPASSAMLPGGPAGGATIDTAKALGTSPSVTTTKTTTTPTTVLGSTESEVPSIDPSHTPLPEPERCCVKCAALVLSTPPLTAEVAPSAPDIDIESAPLPVQTMPSAPDVRLSPAPRTLGYVGGAVLNTDTVDCKSIVSGAFCVATETEFNDKCKGQGEMYPTASCLTESDAKGFCVVC